MAWLRWLLLVWPLCLAGCLGVPEKVQIVPSVDANKYLGTWYEIARLDHSFERGLSQVTATYSKNEDGSMKVVNRGYDEAKQKWQEAIGKAYFIDPANADGSYSGKLKVSFFEPFYGAYNIIHLDQPYYNYVMICGPNKDYLWIMSRTPQLSYPIKQALMVEAKQLGFNTDQLIHVNQAPNTRSFKAGSHLNQPSTQ